MEMERKSHQELEELLKVLLPKFSKANVRTLLEEILLTEVKPNSFLPFFPFLPSLFGWASIKCLVPKPS